MKMIDRNSLRVILEQGLVAYILLLASSTSLAATNREFVLDSSGPVDFWYLKNQTEALVPFSGLQACKVAYMDSNSGLIIERVVRDGNDVESAPTKVMRPRFQYKVMNPGPGLQYELPLYALISVDPNRNFEGKSFPMYGMPTPKAVDIYYRIRCANDEIGALKVTHGVLLRYKEPSSTSSENFETGSRAPAATSIAKGMGIDRR